MSTEREGERERERVKSPMLGIGWSTQKQHSPHNFLTQFQYPVTKIIIKIIIIIKIERKGKDKRGKKKEQNSNYISMNINRDFIYIKIFDHIRI